MLAIAVRNNYQRDLAAEEVRKQVSAHLLSFEQQLYLGLLVFAMPGAWLCFVKSLTALPVAWLSFLKLLCANFELSGDRDSKKSFLHCSIFQWSSVLGLAIRVATISP